MTNLLGLVVILLLSSGIHGWKVWPCDNTTLGIEQDDIKNNQMNATTSMVGGEAWRARLHHPGGWRAAVQDNKQYLQIDLLELYQVNGFLTQGNSQADEWVTSYDFVYSITGANFIHYRQGLVLRGNVDRNTVEKQLFMMHPKVIGRYFRILPLTWHNRISMRIELAGCKKSPGIKLKCTRDGMRLRIIKNLLLPLRPDQLQLLNPNCTGVQVTEGGRDYYEFYTSLGGCKTLCFVTPNFIHYYNVVSQLLHKAGMQIWRLSRFRIPFSCTYRTVKTITSIGLHPNTTVLQLSQHELGIFPVSLTIHESEQYNKALKAAAGEAAAKVDLNQQLYAELELTSGDPHLVMKAEDCWATPTNDSNSLPKYYLIRNGKKVDPTVIWHPMTPKNRKKQRFSFRSFVLLKHHKYIYLHCRIRMCKEFEGFCDPRPGKRGLNDEDTTGKSYAGDHYTDVISHGVPFKVRQGRPLYKKMAKDGALGLDEVLERDAHTRQGPMFTRRVESDLDAEYPDPAKPKFRENRRVKMTK